MGTMVNFRAQYNPGGTVGNLVEQDSPSPGFDEIISDFNAKVKECFDNVSKIVDENGEPKVVTHATNSELFTVFKRGERAGLSGKGIYFSPDGVGIWGKYKDRAFKRRD